ncbi:ubl carboxyl-terminal hydrolase 18 isoform X2 [Erpetoichthys calabaricus]|uniref:ubl carboxyl-terminal hydrolase 18 isoform X2 n=1 Tax=Erpetoichthys calabaricus TaxID=27687 RepID=UPI00109EF0C1|nr:ubl carboxyl-terminal hydrolase 18 isoform X2 [Erpetoichthys calabaricus]
MLKFLYRWIFSSSSTHLTMDYHTMSISGIIGLPNYGLSCCVNSLLQSFFATPELTSLLNKCVEFGKKIPEDRNVPLNLLKLTEDVQNCRSVHSAHRKLLQCLDKNRITHSVQHDAGEIFLSFLHLIHKQTESPELAEEILQLYKITVLDYLQCNVCQNISQSNSFLLTLLLDIQGPSATLEKSIKLFFDPQEISGRSPPFCDFCKEKRPGKKGLKLLSLPKILCLQIKRAYFERHRGLPIKLNSELEFSEMLDLQQILHVDHLAESFQKENCKYGLYAVIVHSGSPICGHYIAYIKLDNAWYCANDSSVYKVPWNEVAKTSGCSPKSCYALETAYMLLYRRSDT